jgi:hypothetical protein
MFENYKVAVRITLMDDVTRPLNLLTKYFLRSEEAAKSLQKRLTVIKDLFKGGGLLFGAGAAVAAPLIYATDRAAELQKQMIAVQIATRGTTQQMDQMRSAIEKIAGVTVFSNIDVAKMAKSIATGTGLGAEQVQGLLPAYAKFADVQLLMKGTPFAQSIPDAIRLAHTAQHYDAKSLENYLNLLTKASFLVPGGLGEVGHALKYSQGIGKTALGIDDENMILFTAFMNRLGLAGSRGGTNAIAAMSRSIPGIFGSGLLKGKSNEALNAMGMIDSAGNSKAFKNGKFDMFTWMGLIGEYVQREFARHPESIARQDILKNFQHAFGVQGGRVASLLSTPEAMRQFRQIGQTFGEYGGVEGMQKKFADESVAQQYMNAKTNFTTALTELGYTLLPTATKILQKFNTYIGQLITWMNKNPDKVKQYATNIALLAGALAGLGIVSMIASGVTGLVTALGFLRTAIIATTALAGSTTMAANGAVGVVASKIPLAGAVLAASYGLTRLIANAVTPEDFTFGGWLYDKTHPSKWSGGAPTGGKSGVHVTVVNKLDKNGFSTMVSQAQSKALFAPQTGLSSFDSVQGLLPSGGF